MSGGTARQVDYVEPEERVPIKIGGTDSEQCGLFQSVNTRVMQKQ